MTQGSTAGQIYLVRHADAGDRSVFDQPDYVRPLTPKGEWQAAKIAEYLSPAAPRRIVSSRAVRCVSTVTPLARMLSIEVEELDVLFEGSDPKVAFSDLVNLYVAANGALVACSHGDVIPGIVELLVDHGVPHGEIIKIKKGAMVELTLAGIEVTQMRFVQRPRSNQEQP